MKVTIEAPYSKYFSQEGEVLETPVDLLFNEVLLVKVSGRDNPIPYKTSELKIADNVPALRPLLLPSEEKLVEKHFGREVTK